MRYFENPYPDFGSELKIDKDKIIQLINRYVSQIANQKTYADGDLYVGGAGIAFMFLKIHQSNIEGLSTLSSLQAAQSYLHQSKKFVRHKSEDAVSFLCGNAGYYAVSAIVNQCLSNRAESEKDLQHFLQGVNPSLHIVVNSYGSDEILFGRAGYLSGIYWLNQNLPADKKISALTVSHICEKIIESGVGYSNRHNLTAVPMMWECYGDRYMGAAHGVCAILHVLLESPLFAFYHQQQQIVKDTLNILLSTQSADGNFPCLLENSSNPEHELVHWCHGAPGVIYVLAKAYLLFNDPRYLEACVKCGELVWKKGLLTKGPGLCHGIAGNGYVFLILYRLTLDEKYLYRAGRFADFLTSDTFTRNARRPDKPMSLYEGLAGTVCFLIDLLQPTKASFPFMDVFDTKY